MITRFIGDVHGEMDNYLALLPSCERSIQVGDFGAGFVPLPSMDLNHRFIRGNHDSPDVCRAHPNWIKDGTIDNDVMFVGGAYSIDYLFRTPGVSWWFDEELSWPELDTIIDLYIETKPRIMVTHDGPQLVMKKMFPFLDRHSRTQVAFQHMFDMHKPELWVCGHWHEDRNEVIQDTRFICLGELSYMDIDLT